MPSASQHNSSKTKMNQPNLWDKVPDTIVLVCDCVLEVKMVNMIYWEAD